jgi:hypothetical protein
MQRCSLKLNRRLVGLHAAHLEKSKLKTNIWSCLFAGRRAQAAKEDRCGHGFAQSFESAVPAFPGAAAPRTSIVPKGHTPGAELEADTNWIHRSMIVERAPGLTRIRV